MPQTLDKNTLDDGLKKVCGGASLALFVAGVVARALPLLNFGGRMYRQFPTEDGYLMLTIARNLALGRGMSTAEGEMPTNGTQPLFNLVQAGVFWLFEGDRYPSVLLVQICSLFVSAAGAWLLYLIGKRLLSERLGALAAPTALLAAGLWFASPTNLPHTMNCLETGLYQTLGLLSFLSWTRFQASPSGKSARWGASALLGVSFGLTFLARIDAAFLILALTAWNVLPALQKKVDLGARLQESVVMGVVSIAVGSPWLIYNYFSFGSIMPISGTAQSYGASLGSNATELPGALFEFISIVLLIPHKWTETTWMMTLGSVVVAGYLWVGVRFVRSLDATSRLVMAAAATYAGFLLAYYGLYFGADHFVPRYLSPISPWAALLTVSLLMVALREAGFVPKRVWLGATAVGALLLLGIGLDVRTYVKGIKHMHFQVLGWVQEHVAEEQWVGAIQTGTVGFFHERTVNLDGKVNPAALQAKLQGQIPQYVVSSRFGKESRPIEYLVDWETIAGWSKLPPLDREFELIVNDGERRLGVLKRVEPQATTARVTADSAEHSKSLSARNAALR